MLLHTVSKSPFNNSSFNDCVNSCNQNSAILLIEDGVYAAKNNTDSASIIENKTTIKFYALEADVIARGLTDRLCQNITLANDDDFVSLVEQYNNVVSWY